MLFVVFTNKHKHLKKKKSTVGQIVVALVGSLDLLNEDGELAADILRGANS